MKRNSTENLLDNYTIESKAENSDETLLRDRSTGQLVLMKELQIFGTDRLKAMVDTLSTQKTIRS